LDQGVAGLDPVPDSEVGSQVGLLAVFIGKADCEWLHFANAFAARHQSIL